MTLCLKNDYSIKQDDNNIITILQNGTDRIYRARYSRRLTHDELKEYLNEVLVCFGLKKEAKEAYEEII